MTNNLTHNDWDLVGMAGWEYSDLEEFPSVREKALNEAAYLLALTISSDEWYEILAIWERSIMPRGLPTRIEYDMEKAIVKRAMALRVREG